MARQPVLYFTRNLFGCGGPMVKFVHGLRGYTFLILGRYFDSGTPILFEYPSYFGTLEYNYALICFNCSVPFLGLPAAGNLRVDYYT